MIYIIKTVLLFKRERNSLIKTDKNKHCKSVCIRSFSGPCFPTFGLNAERYGASLLIQFECGKIRTRKIRDTDTFHAVKFRTN